MSNKSKLLLVLLAALILFYLVFVEHVFDTVSFDKGLEKIVALDEKFTARGLVPQEEQELKEYNEQLVDLEKEFSGKKQDDDSKALLLLVKARKELVLMQLSLIEVQKSLTCQEQLDAMDSVISSAESARDSVQEYLDYSFSEETIEWNENALDTTNSIILSFREIKDQRSC